MSIKANLFTDIPKDLSDEVLETLVKSDDVTIERIISFGNVTPEGQWYDQEKDEWVAVLQGSAKLCFENEQEIILEAGDFLNIPAHKKHRVSWTQPDKETIWLAIHYTS